MRCLDDCHHYILDGFENPEVCQQELMFINKKPTFINDEGKDKQGELVTVHDGTTNEEVLVMLIHRIGELNVKLECLENCIALNCLKAALGVLELRTKTRKAQGVEGAPKAHE